MHLDSTIVMTVLSKLCGDCGLKIVNYNCYELAHTWTPSCSVSAFDVLKAASSYSLNIYAAFYILSTIVKRPKLNDLKIRRLLSDILRSSIFLTVNSVGFISAFCVIRQLLGFHILPSLGFLPGFVSSLAAILLESKRRRGLLASYTSQLAIEILFNMAVSRGLCSPVPNGELLLFAASIAGFMALLSLGKLDETTSSILKLVFDLDGVHAPSSSGLERDSERQKTPFRVTVISRYLPMLKHWWLYLQNLGRTELCTSVHRWSCPSFIVDGFMRNFFVTYAAATALKLPFGLLQSMKTRQFSKLFSRIFNRGSLGLAMCAGLLPTIYRLVGCLSRLMLSRYFMQKNTQTTDPLAGVLQKGNKLDVCIQLISGFLCGFSLWFFKSSSVALYAVWKLIEVLYLRSSERYSILPRFYYGDAILYATATGFMLHAAIMEPQAIRPQYWKFLLDLTGDRFEKINRFLLDSFGYCSSQLFGGFNPVLDPTLTSINPFFLASHRQLLLIRN